MIKLNKATGELSRSQIPKPLMGLKTESLLDLSWTDPALGLQDFAWLPETDQSESLGDFQRYGQESFKLSKDGLSVIVTKEIIDWAQEEIDAHTETKREQKISELSTYFSSISQRPAIETGYGFTVQAGYSDLLDFQVGLKRGLLTIRAADNSNHTVTQEQLEDIISQIEANGIRLKSIKWALQDEIAGASIEELETINFEERFAV